MKSENFKLTSNPATPAWESIWRIRFISRSLFCDWNGDCGVKCLIMKIIDRRQELNRLPVDFEVAAATADRMTRIRLNSQTATARFVSLPERWLCRRGVSPLKAFCRPMSSLLKRLIKSVISLKTPTNNDHDRHKGRWKTLSSFLSHVDCFPKHSMKPSSGFSSFNWTLNRMHF